MNTTKTLLLIAAMLVVGCEQRPRHVHHTKQKVTEYRQHGTSDDGSDTFIYWYAFDCNNRYYYYSSLSEVSESDFDSIPWQSSANPMPIDASQLEQVAQMEVPDADLGAQVAQEVDTTDAQIDAMVNEGNPNTGDSGADSSGDSSTSGDAGGGDTGGGGDGGGGGE